MTIFDFLASFDRKDYLLREKLSEEEAKELDNFVGYLALRWMSAADNTTDHQMSLLNVNEINRTYFSLYKHPELQAKLMAYAGLGEKTRRSYIKGPKALADNKLYQVVRMRYPDADNDDCKFYLQNCGRESFETLCRQTGHQPKTTKATNDKPTIDELVKLYEDM